MTVRLDLGGVSFEWDLEKAWINRLKHGVDFREAATTFLDLTRRHADTTITPRWRSDGR